MTHTFHFPGQIIAHRGASAYAPENTMLAFQKAVELGAKCIEFDVMQAACGELVIFHDELLDRTTNQHGALKSYPYSYLKTLDAGSWFDKQYQGEAIPQFKSVLYYALKQNISVNIEMKAVQGEEMSFVDALVKEIAQEKLFDSNRVIFSSFSLATLYALRSCMPYAYLGFLIHEWESDWAYQAKTLNCISVHVNDEILSHDQAEYIKLNYNNLAVYTVNEIERALTLFEWGVDAIFTDYPDLLARKI